MTCFVTGATGFLGSTLVHRLLQDGHTVRALRRATSSMDLVGEAASSVTWIDGDLFDDDALSQGMQGADVVFHCAAYLGFTGKRSLDRLFRVNVEGTARIMNAAIEHGVKRVVHVSSIAALGRSPDRSTCLDETAEWVDSPLNTAYGYTKFLAEMEVQRAIAEGLDAVIVNPALVMGPGRAGENTMQIVEQIRHRRLPFSPPGSTNVVDVEDVVTGMLLALERGSTGTRYILSGHNLPWTSILSALGDALGVKPPTRTIPRAALMLVATVSEAAGWLFRFDSLITRESARLSTSMSCYDNTRARTELGYEPRPFTETAARIAAAL